MKKSLFILLIIILFGCDIPYINNEYSSDKVTSFNYLCDQFEDHYVFTDYKNLDIDNLRATYTPLVKNDMTDEDFFSVLSDFTNEFKDGHSNIMAPFGRSSAYSIILDEEADDYNPNFNYRTIKYNYLNSYQILGYSLINGIIDRGGKKYGYIYYPSFMEDISAYDIETILDRFTKNEVEGVILDIRSNGGGSVFNVITLASYFGYDASKKSKKVINVWRRDSKTKYTKVEALDLTLGVSISFDITRNDKAYNGPVALLTNRGSYSASSFTATAFKAFDNVKQIGDSTGGGMGLPIGGTMPNGWKYRFSGNICLDYRAKSYNDSQWNYESGVPADIAIDDDLSKEDTDEILEAAIAWIDSY